MQQHLSNGYFKQYPGGQRTREEAEVIGSGLSQAISANSRSPDTIKDANATLGTKIKFAGLDKGQFSSTPESLNSAIAPPLEPEVAKWNNWEVFSPNSKSLSQDYIQWLSPPEVSSLNGSSLTEKYKGLNSLPAVNHRADMQKRDKNSQKQPFSDQFGNIPVTPDKTIWKNSENKMDVVFRLMTIGDRHSHCIAIRSESSTFGNITIDEMYDMLKNFGEIQGYFFRLFAQGLAFVAYFDINAAIQAQYCLSASGFPLRQQAMQQPSLSVEFSAPFESHADLAFGHASIALFASSTNIPAQEIQQFCSQWGPIAGMNNFDANPSIYIIRFNDTRHALKAVHEMNGLIRWGVELRAQVASPPMELQERLTKFVLLASSEELRDNSETPALVMDSSNNHPNCQFPYQGTTSSILDQESSPNPSLHEQNRYPPRGIRSMSNPNISTNFFSNAYPLEHQPGTRQQFGADPFQQSPYNAWGRCYPPIDIRSVHPAQPPTFQGNGRSMPFMQMLNQPSAPAQNPVVFSMNGTSKRTNARFNDSRQNTGRNDQGSGEFSLSIDNVRSGLDKRTTLMIRNIPNKYTQHMLLSEINQHQKELYDFFYLPIDFKNKCNMGYAFINFIDYSSILPFYQEFNNQKWRNFNSEKVCAISYARLQGKAAMIARFQNSSLLDKDESYRPLVFCSSGTNKGKAEPFPVGKTVRKNASEEWDQEKSTRDSSSKSYRSFPQMVDDKALGSRQQPA